MSQTGPRWRGISAAPCSRRMRPNADFSVEDLVARAGVGNAKAIAAREATARYLGLGLASVINALDHTASRWAHRTKPRTRAMRASTRWNEEARPLRALKGCVIWSTRGPPHTRTRATRRSAATPSDTYEPRRAVRAALSDPSS